MHQVPGLAVFDERAVVLRDEARAALAAAPTRFADKQHPYGRPDSTLRDYYEWCLTNGGASSGRGIHKIIMEG